MGKRGPAPKPTALRVLQGGHPERVNLKEPVPSDRPIEAPAYLDADARAVWDRVVPDLIRQGVMTHWDSDCMAVYVTAIVHHRRAVDLVNQTNVLIAASGGHKTIVKHPAMQIIRDQAAVIKSFAQQFGLTPAARSEITRPGEREPLGAERLLS
jgi:P27 family predicted phage terminase small subunit